MALSLRASMPCGRVRGTAGRRTRVGNRGDCAISLYSWFNDRRVEEDFMFVRV